MKVTQSTDPDFFTARGLQSTTPERLNDALRLVLEAMPTLLYAEVSEKMPSEELAILEAGGVNQQATSKRDPLAETAVQYAAMIASSVNTKETSERMGMPQSQVRQMIARRTLYSVLLNNRRFIPLFQFEQDGALVANITKVNAALNPSLHPVEVYDWYTQKNLELFIGNDINVLLSPLQWLRSGGDVKKLVMLARNH